MGYASLTIAILYAVGALASGVAACLAWAAKLKWSSEFAKAKDEIIKAKDAQIETLHVQLDGLRELTPMKIREYVESSKALLSDFIDQLKGQLEQARTEINERDERIHNLHEAGATQDTTIQKLQSDRDTIERRASELQTKVAALEKKVPPFEYDVLAESFLSDALSSSASLANSLGADSTLRWSVLRRLLDARVQISRVPSIGEALSVDKPAIAPKAETPDEATSKSAGETSSKEPDETTNKRAQ